MNRRLASVFVFALLVSGVASFFVYHFVVTSMETASRKPKQTQKILVAAHTLEMGTLIKDTDLAWQDSATAPTGLVINDRQLAAGRGVIATIYEGEPIAEGRLAPKGAGAGLAAMIPVGMRAVALKIDEVVGLAGFVVPGMRVDVIIAGGGNSENGHNGILSRTILQSIEVLSAGKKIEKTADGKPQDAQVVNLLVTPDQAEVLSLASSETKVQLVLRNPLDTKEEKTHGTSVAALFGQELAPVVARNTPPPMPRIVVPAAPKPEPEGPTVEVFSGVKRSEQRLDAR